MLKAMSSPLPGWVNARRARLRIMFIYAKYKISVANSTIKNLLSMTNVYELQDRFLLVLIACGTYGMRRFAALHRFFHNIGKGTSSEVLEFIAFSLTFPCFELSNALYKIVSFLFERRIRLLSRDSFSVRRRYCLIYRNKRRAKFNSVMRGGKTRYKLF